MLSFRSDVRAAMTSKKARLAVMARTEVTTDVPEHADLYQAFPGTDWNVRARGLGGTVARPATSCAEENLLCDTKDPYVGENILVHELSHGIVNLGVTFADTTFQGRLDTAYRSAIAAGKFHPFSGRLLDNEGRVRQEAGSMADEALNRIDWYVQGVQGKMPRG